MFLNEELLLTIRERADYYDRTNQFPKKDYQDLKDAGYTKAFVPKEYGGFGLSLKEIAQEQTRLAMYAPATALGINMHHIIVGVASHMVKNGNMKGEQILKDAASGKLLAFGISEPANDRVLFGSICKAEKDDNNGYTFNGPKVFISMIHECDNLVTYAHSDEGEQGLSVFAYLDNDRESIVIDENWDTLGMRGTQSHNMTLTNAYAPESRILTKTAPVPSNDPVVFGIFAYFEILLAATYHGIGKRALELGITTIKKRKSVANNTTYDQDKNIRWRISDSAIMLDAIQPQIDQLSDDFENGVDHGTLWMPKLSAIKNRSVEASIETVNQMVRASGGRSYYNDQELSRLLRDVYAGLFQPSDQESLHDAWAQVLIGGID
ncbi:acyl-CoA dehydrogenase family protein [Erysipelothrix urinaevulpis]|uniref:acyl-CoA dehydrogenase family protein n=1 Tax=Erysipelothrix urinaevulpis TaxID=2683717 RepID=UPI001359BE3B|nr:acyl-CoA dehydrogenase family protein [Erysipelothrix urinaevulpis]